MKIVIASDHQGYKRKQQILAYLRRYNYDVVDLGTDSLDNVDYTVYCKKLCEEIKKEDSEYGILICGTGIGMSICANKIKGIYCAKANTKKEAMLSRKDNNANVLALSKRLPMFRIKRIILGFLHTPFSEEERYVRRINDIKKLEK